MHKWKLFKKSAALVLSSAVIASGVPVTAMASEAEVFSDVSEETQGETAQEKERTRIRSLFPRASRKLVKLISSRKSRKKVMQKLFRKK